MTEPVVDAARLLTIRPREQRWAHLSLCVLDAVFSIGARYGTTVRTCETYARHAGITTLDRGDGPIGTSAEQPLEALVAEVQAVGDDRFAAEVLANRQRTSSRGGVLKAEAARRYAEALVRAGVHRYSDVEALLDDAARLAALEEELRRVPGNGTGDVRLGYLWMLVGHDRMIKPDRMVLRWLARVLGRAVSVAEARTLLEGAALELGCTPWELDHAVWNAERGTRPVVDSDTKARRRHRAQQGRWREEVLGMPSGGVDSMLPAKHGDANLLSSAAVAYARERIPAVKAVGGVVEEGRLWRNMLSSQPLAFSIVGELRAHPDAALAVLSSLTGTPLAAFDRIDDGDRTLDGLQAEWAPRETGDRSAADVAAAVRTADGRRLLVTVEVKYTEPFSPAPLKEGFDVSGAGLDAAAVDGLHGLGGTQFLRSVLLTDSVRRRGLCDDVVAVVLARGDDDRARSVVGAVGTAVPAVPTLFWSIERFADAAATQPALAEWADVLGARYVLA